MRHRRRRQLNDRPAFGLDRGSGRRRPEPLHSRDKPGRDGRRSGNVNKTSYETEKTHCARCRCSWGRRDRIDAPFEPRFCRTGATNGLRHGLARGIRERQTQARAALSLWNVFKDGPAGTAAISLLSNVATDTGCPPTGRCCPIITPCRIVMKLFSRRIACPVEVC